jgi:hypothetical protein
MSEMKIKVPDGMMQAGRAVYSGYVTAEEGARRILEAALRWQRDNAPLPSAEFVAEFMKLGWSVPPLALRDFGCRYARCMYDAPEPEYIGAEKVEDFCARYQRIDEAVREAYRRGQQSKQVQF